MDRDASEFLGGLLLHGFIIFVMIACYLRVSFMRREGKSSAAILLLVAGIAFYIWFFTLRYQIH